jgi:hypothetical protein
MTLFAKLCLAVLLLCMAFGAISGGWNGAFGGAITAGLIVGGLLWSLGGDD